MKYFIVALIHVMTLCSITIAVFSQELDSTDGGNSADLISDASIDATWLQKNIAGLGASIPNDIVEMRPRIKPLLSDGVRPERIEIGKMRTEKWHFVAIRFVNMFDKAIRVMDVASSCGCLVAGNTRQVIEPDADGLVIAVMKPQTRPALYRKSITVTFDNGLVWPIMISGIFESEFQFEKDVVKVNPVDREVVVSILRKFGNRDVASVVVESQSGNLIARETIRDDNDRLNVTFSVPVVTRRSAMALSEQVVVRDKESGNEICQLIIGVDAATGLQCRPRRVLLTQKDNHFVGVVYLVGNMKAYKDIPKCELKCKGLSVEASFRSVGAAGAELELKSEMANVLTRGKEEENVSLFLNGELICEDLKLDFYEE